MYKDEDHVERTDHELKGRKDQDDKPVVKAKVHNRSRALGCCVIKQVNPFDVYNLKINQ